MQRNQHNLRAIAHKLQGVPTSDGAGVQLTRFIGTAQFDHLDPFLLLDAFRSDNANDYIAGFPPHPHRGFETVTYMIEGQMRHKDNAGHSGVIKSGGVQWMTAGKGIVHSEMPEQSAGLLWGYQLWLNLPAEAKMSAPHYQEYSANEIPIEQRDDISVKVIAGVTQLGTQGVISQPYTQPLYLDVSMPSNAVFQESIVAEHNAFIVVLSGSIEVLSDADQSNLAGKDELLILDNGDSVKVTAHSDDNRFLLIAGKPLRETVARAGPFVMNTASELQKAFNDFRDGNF